MSGNGTDGWQTVQSAPERQIVDTCIIDAAGIRNVGRLKREGRLWFVPNGGMYVYYTPTHWRSPRP